MPAGAAGATPRPGRGHPAARPGTPALVGFHTGDRPSDQLLVLNPCGVARVRFAADGRRTLVSGGGEDLCRTLA